MSNGSSQRVTRVVLGSNSTGNVGGSGTPSTFMNTVMPNGFSNGDMEYCYVKLESVSPLIVSSTYTSGETFVPGPVEIQVDLPQDGSCDARTSQTSRTFGFMKANPLYTINAISDSVNGLSGGACLGWDYDMPLEGVKVTRDVFAGVKWGVRFVSSFTGTDVCQHYNATAPALLCPVTLVFTVSTEPL